MWSDLQELNEKKTGSGIFFPSIERLTFSGKVFLFVSLYVSKLKELWEKQLVLINIPSCNCGTSQAYMEVMQQQKLLQFLMGLNESCSQAHSQILLMLPLPSDGQAYGMILEDEAQKSIASREKSSPIDGIAMAMRGRGCARGREIPTLSA